MALEKTLIMPIPRFLNRSPRASVVSNDSLPTAATTTSTAAVISAAKPVKQKLDTAANSIDNFMTEKELRSLDVWIAEHVFGCKPVKKEYSFGIAYECQCLHKVHADGGDDGLDDSISHYHRDPAAAMQVLKKCAEKIMTIGGGRDIHIHKSIINGHWMVVQMGNDSIRGCDQTLELAIALFAQKLFGK